MLAVRKILDQLPGGGHVAWSANDRPRWQSDTRFRALETERTRLQHRKQTLEADLVALDHQVDEAQARYAQLATARLIGDVTPGDAAAARAEVEALTATRTTSVHELTDVRDELSRVDAAHGEIKKRAQLAAAPAFIAEFKDALAEQQVASRVLKDATARVVAAKDAIEHDYVNPATGRLENFPLSTSVLGLAERWRDYFFERPKSQHDWWLENIREHFPEL